SHFSAAREPIGDRQWRPSPRRACRQTERSVDGFARLFLRLDPHPRRRRLVPAGGALIFAFAPEVAEIVAGVLGECEQALDHVSVRLTTSACWPDTSRP